MNQQQPQINAAPQIFQGYTNVSAQLFQTQAALEQAAALINQQGEQIKAQAEVLEMLKQAIGGNESLKQQMPDELLTKLYDE